MVSTLMMKTSKTSTPFPNLFTQPCSLCKTKKFQSIHLTSNAADLLTSHKAIMMQYDVMNLNFDMSNETRITKLPPRIFSFKWLQVLKLTNIRVGDFDQVDFPHLKTLHLNSVYFSSDEYILKFLLGCPILENLQSGLYTGRKDNIIENLNHLPNLVEVRIFRSNTPMALLCKTKILHMEQV
ncbi:hypothetical protein QL285_060127 [Trifolium repens]|nr:hypothetical protein QL285_060127 [Trifolium repens]